MVTKIESEPKGSISNFTVNWSMFFVSLVWGINYTAVKVGLTSFTPLAFVALRFTAGTLMLSLLLWLREGIKPLFQNNGRRLIALGIIGNTLYQTCFIIGLSKSTVANSTFILATTPAFVTLMGALLGVERLTRAVKWGVMLALLGILLVIGAHSIALSWQTMGGDLLLLAAVVCYSIYTLGVRAISNDGSSLRITALTVLTGTPGLVLIAIPDLVRLDWRHIGLLAWGGLVYSVFLGLVAAYMLWNRSVRLVGSGRTAIFLCVTPLVAALVAWPLLGERPTFWQSVGAVLIVAGVFLTQRRSVNT